MNNNGSASQHPGAADVDQNLTDGVENDQIQQNEQQNSEQSRQADTGADGQDDHSSVQAAAPIVLSELALHPPTWPAAGFADDDPAAAHMIAIMQSLETRPPRPNAVEDIIILPTTNAAMRQYRPFEQLLRRQVTDGGNHNFFLPFPDHPGEMIGKVGFSMAGLAIMIEALRAVVRGYGDTMSIAPLSQHVDRLNAANGTMHFVTPRKWDQLHYCDIYPFTPEGARTAAAALQAALRHPAYKYGLFYATGVADPSLKRTMVACLEVHPIQGWSN